MAHTTAIVLSVMKLPSLAGFDVYTPEAQAAATIVSDMYVKLGRPQDPFTRSGEKMMNILISVWQDLYPQEYRDWLQTKKEYQLAELSTREQVHRATGRSLASVPTPLYKMMKRIFPEFKMNSREDFMKLTQKYPFFRMTNKL